MEFYPSVNNFTLALLLMLVTNITSAYQKMGKVRSNKKAKTLPEPACSLVVTVSVRNVSTKKLDSKPFL